MSKRKTGIQIVTAFFMTAPAGEAEAALAVARTIVAARTAPPPRAAKVAKAVHPFNAAEKAQALAARDKDVQ